MAVYRRSYTPYRGPLTPGWSRRLALCRYSRKGLFRSRFQSGLFVFCFFFPVLGLIAIYLAHNLIFLQQIGTDKYPIRIDNTFFFYFTYVQGGWAVVLTAFAGSGLIAPDLAHGALPLYFCRSFSRADYVLGKAFVLLTLLSEITWIPGLLLFAVQATLAGPSWAWDHLWIAGSLVLSCLIWIAILSLVAMALSAWVKWRMVAGALLLAVLFLGAGFAQAVHAVLRTQLGDFLSLAYLTTRVCLWLFRIDNSPSMSPLAAWVSLLVYCGICLALLIRKVRAYEVVP